MSTVWINIKQVLSILGTIFGHPILIVAGVYLTIYFEYELTSYKFALIMIGLAFVRYCFFYFWNYEKIKHISFIEGFRFFTSLQLFQVFFTPYYLYLQIVSFHYSEGIVLVYYCFGVLILGFFVFIYMQMKLSKYQKFNFEERS